MSEKNTCSYRTYEAWGLAVGCESPIEHQHEGRPYCDYHHPPNVEARRVKRAASAKAFQDAQEKRIEATTERDRKAADYDRLAAENERLKARLKSIEEEVMINLGCNHLDDDGCGDIDDCVYHALLHEAQWAAEDENAGK